MRRFIAALVTMHALLRIAQGVPGVDESNVYLVTARASVNFADALPKELK